MTWYCATQPQLFPPLYLLERYARVDTCVIMSEAQFDKETIRVRLHLLDGPRSFRPSVSGSSRGAYFEQKVDAEAFVKKLKLAAYLNYSKMPGYKEVASDWDRLLIEMSDVTDLPALCTLSMQWLLHVARVPCELVDAYDLVGPRHKNPSTWIASMGAALNAGNYVQGRVGLSSYLQLEVFQALNIAVWAQNAKFSGDASLSALDVLFRHGVEALRREINCKSGTGPAAASVQKWEG